MNGKDVVVRTTVALFAGVILLSACMPTTQGAEQADDILNTPAGYAYRANVHQQGTADKWPEIIEHEVSLSRAGRIVEVAYRDQIQTGAGQTRNDILALTMPDVTSNSPSLQVPMVVDVTLKSASAGFTMAESQAWHGADPGRRVQVVVKIHVASDLEPNSYPLEFGLMVNGQDFGELRCTFTVLN
jgi:hypothetical protein